MGTHNYMAALALAAFVILIAGARPEPASALVPELVASEADAALLQDDGFPGDSVHALSTDSQGRSPQICRCWLGNYEIVRTWTTTRAACNKKGQRAAKSYRAANPRRFGNAPLTCQWGGISL